MVTQAKIDAFVEQCRRKNLKVTPQRLAIYKALVQDGSHPNPETIYARIKDAYPTISFATVYKTLETFENHGIISRVTNLHETARYDPEIDHHHHIICVRCKKVIDLFDETLNRLPVPSAVTASNNLINFSVHFNVICEECRNKQ